jgi:hypothetical protein
VRHNRASKIRHAGGILALVLFLYGLMQLALLWWFKLSWGRLHAGVLVGIVVLGGGAFGLALDRYVASFVITGERLMFLVIILPVVVLFLIVFGLMGRWAGQRVGSATAGIAHGLILAWSLAASFPLFEA